MKKVSPKLPPTDADLFLLVRESDDRAFQKLFNKYWKSLYAFAYSFTKDEDISKDIVQEVWIKLWDKREELEIDNIKAYLHSMIRNKVFNQLRDNKTLVIQLKEIDKYLTVDNISDLTDFAHTNQMLEDAIAKLPYRNREIFILSRFDGLSNQDISEKLGISKRTVENHITNSLRHIRKSVFFALIISSF